MCVLLSWASACGSSGSSSVATGGGAGFIGTDPGVVLSTQPPAFTLQVLHASDLEASLAAVQDAPRFSAVVNALRPQFPNTVVLSSGDNYIPSPFYNASTDPSLDSRYNRTPGKADIEILNAIGFEASAFGNHEFDQGTRQIRDLIRPDSGRGYAGARFPYLSANLSFSGTGELSSSDLTANGQEASSIRGKIAKTAVITVGGERIGLVGATTTRLAGISSPGPEVTIEGSFDETDQVNAFVLQPFVDELTAQGINKIFLLAHLQQLQNEVNLASQLRNVDVIIAGGSHRVLAKPQDRLRTDLPDRRTGDYPILRISPSGQPVAVVNAASNYRYVGRLVVSFDANGVISAVDPLSGAYATDDQGVAAVGGTPNPDVLRVANDIGNIIRAKDGRTFGSTTNFLNGLRAEVRTEETNLGNLTADANLAYAKTIDPSTVISLKNGGGIRAPIGATTGGGGGEPVQRIPPLANPDAGKQSGQISQLDIESSLAFNNGLSLLTVTASELKQVAEHGVAQTQPGATPGRFPQIGGFAFSFDPSRPPGSRVLSLRVDTPTGRDVVVQNGQVQGDPNRTFRMVTLGFLANGGDDYPFKSFSNINQVDLAPRSGITFDTPGSEQNALSLYLQQIGVFTDPDTPAAEDTRIQNLSVRRDTVL
ncbi:bifunctional metallophosphatase/5'-nucleotidase [Synechococcus sp. Nb3U1]|uniref:bifunctional metallophosphatase/5'-nucleotidase n=1 Tax=Synechococcus sp. Nb3U1 TaxID=1914529 RepID=UPI001F23F870|nr:bifunctional metallophosphatase/5'-nucleotidase [Synechococcus sp. Nb3U1]MCF2971471.1 bifunctional metallophosphatase/5'-nucleotidase [Synechococcus sp. Nb3U1]